MHCWYRNEGNAGQPLVAEYDHVMISYKTSKFGSQMKFMINWINSENRGVTGLDDLMNNVFPELLKYFKESNQKCRNGLYFFLPYSYFWPGNVRQHHLHRI